MGKVVFFVIDLTWKLFSQTGNIEAYLLMKELEDNNKSTREVDPSINLETSLNASENLYTDLTKL